MTEAELADNSLESFPAKNHILRNRQYLVESGEGFVSFCLLRWKE